jgi:hypothetical protein
VLALLEGGADIRGVAAYLSEAADDLGSHGNSARDRQTAEAVIAWHRARA